MSTWECASVRKSVFAFETGFMPWVGIINMENDVSLLQSYYKYWILCNTMYTIAVECVSEYDTR